VNALTVSVIVATRNRPTYLRDLFDSLRTSTHSPMEVIIVNDGGTARDENARVVTEAARALTVRFEVNERAQGTVRALNRGASLARGTILTFTDDDCIVDAGWLARLVAGYALPQVGGVGGRVIPIENDRVRPLTARPDLRIGRVDADGTVTSNFDLTGDQVLEVDHLAGPNMSFRREIFERFGGFDANYAGNCYRFETDWGVRVRRAGFSLLFDPRATVAHRRAPTGGNRVQAEEWFYWYACNHLYFLAKNFPTLRAARWRFALRLLIQVARQERLPAHLGACSRGRAIIRACCGAGAGFMLAWRVPHLTR
jgi:GT2 family glycosyltransferase